MIPKLGLFIAHDHFQTISIRIQAKARHLLVAEYLKNHPVLIPPFLEMKVHYTDVLSAAMDAARRQGRGLDL